jgi:hypothetical protein
MAKKCAAAWLPVNIGKLLLHFAGAPSPESIDTLGMVVLNLLLPVLQAGLQPQYLCILQESDVLGAFSSRPVPFKAAYRHFALVEGAYTSLPALPNDKSRVPLNTGVQWHGSHMVVTIWQHEGQLAIWQKCTRDSSICLLVQDWLQSSALSRPS